MRGWTRGVRAILVALGLSTVAIASGATPARADYRFCNATSYVLSSAIAFPSGNDWKSQGWFRLLPGECKPVLRGRIDHEVYYVLARSIEAHRGGRKYFSGSDRFCTVGEDFLIAGRGNCAARGYDSNDFTRVETRTGKDWTTTFEEPANYTLKQAKIAGIQRLLQDNGLKINKIDGLEGNHTTRAVMAFQRSLNIRPTGAITDGLFASLIEAADAQQRKSGLILCNKTEFLVWSAVGYEKDDALESSGWIRIEPGRCEKAIKGELKNRYYYAYAEAVDEAGNIARRNDADLVWGGDHDFCTKTTRFEIRGVENCSGRGYDETGFRRIDTGEEVLWTETLE